jgi:hypothetical protein
MRQRRAASDQSETGRPNSPRFTLNARLDRSGTGTAATWPTTDANLAEMLRRPEIEASAGPGYNRTISAVIIVT